MSGECVISSTIDAQEKGAEAYRVPGGEKEGAGMITAVETV